MKKVLVLLALLSVSLTSRAETYLDLKESETPVQILQRYPNSRFKENSTDGQKNELRTFEWVGIDPLATIYLRFIDGKPIILEVIQSITEKLEHQSDPEKSVLKARLENLQRILAGHEYARLHLASIIYMPKKPISLENIINKYGTPDREDSNENFSRILIWKRGIFAFANIDGTEIVSMLFHFANSESH